MKVFQYKIQDDLGIHARPAGLLAKEAKKYSSVIKLKKGEEVQVTFEGEDEETAYSEIEKFFQKNL